MSKLYESDANNPKKFHTIPDHIKKILYLDAPDLIIEYKDEPICSIEISQEAGTGHNAFQRFPRIAASVENKVPALYIYPEAIIVRRGIHEKWDSINPNIFAAFERAMQIYSVPALLFYFPTDFPKLPSDNRSTKGKIMDTYFISCPDARQSEMVKLFETIDLIIRRTLSASSRIDLLQERKIVERRNWMQSEYTKKGGEPNQGSPISATYEIDTELLIDYLRKFNPACNPDFLKRKAKTVLYQVDAGIRGDPYPGALAALDYLLCRVGHSFEDRDKNLVLVWGKAGVEEDQLRITASKPRESSVEKFMEKIRVIGKDRNKSLLDRKFTQLRPEEIPRYYLHVRYGSMFTKTKEIRCYSYFADAILFHDGALWREG